MFMGFSSSLQDRLLTEFAILLMRGIVSRYAEIKRATAQVFGVRLLSRVSTAKAHEAVRDVIVENPTLSYQQIADLWDAPGGGCTPWRSNSPSGGNSPPRRQNREDRSSEKTAM